MSDQQRAELIAQVDRAIVAWPGVETVPMAGGVGQGGFQVPPGTVYRLGRRELGHIHVTGEADLPFPRARYDELVAAGRAHPHLAGLAGVLTRSVQEPDDVAAVVALFRLNYERARGNESAA